MINKAETFSKEIVPHVLNLKNWEMIKENSVKLET